MGVSRLERRPAGGGPGTVIYRWIVDIEIFNLGIAKINYTRHTGDEGV